MKRSTAEILREYGPFPGVERVLLRTAIARRAWHDFRRSRRDRQRCRRHLGVGSGELRRLCRKGLGTMPGTLIAVLIAVAGSAGFGRVRLYSPKCLIVNVIGTSLYTEKTIAPTPLIRRSWFESRSGSQE